MPPRLRLLVFSGTLLVLGLVFALVAVLGNAHLERRETLVLLRAVHGRLWDQRIGNSAPVSPRSILAAYERALAFNRTELVRGEIDRWGAPVRVQRLHRAVYIYSCGPDGRDDGGEGDDIGLAAETYDDSIERLHVR
jgi:hypothetical protein